MLRSTFASVLDDEIEQISLPALEASSILLILVSYREESHPNPSKNTFCNLSITQRWRRRNELLQFLNQLNITPKWEIGILSKYTVKWYSAQLDSEREFILLFVCQRLCCVDDIILALRKEPKFHKEIYRRNIKARCY